MNKKVSTIFAMAALMGGVFSGSAYAQMLDPIAFPIGDQLDEVSSPVILEQNGASFGFLRAEGATVSTPSALTTSSSVEKTDANNYAWNVVVTPADDTRPYPVYMFTNVATGDTLSFDKVDGHLVVAGTIPAGSTTGKKEWAKNNYYTFSFDNENTTTHVYAPGAYAGGGRLIVEALRRTNGSSMYVDLANILTTPLSAAATTNVTLYSMNQLGIAATELNDLYNGRGFNLDAEKVSGITADVQGNLFNAGAVVWAFDVPNTPITDDSGNVIGYGYVISRNDRNEPLIIPAGTYFFTNPVFQNGGSVATTDPAKINWLASTLIAVSPTETGENTDSGRADGIGFALQTYKGSEFLFITNTSKPQGDDIWINNACFKVESDYTDGYEYAISLPTFYYQKSATAAGTTEQSKVENVFLGVTSYRNAEQSVGTVLDRTHVFQLQASTLVEGIDLLNTTKTPAVYTIKFVNGGDLANKYLTVGSDGAKFQWEAKGLAITDTVYPIFQYVITAVNEDNYVTFTNRETGKTLTTQLFKENGENRYSLSETLKHSDAVTPYTVTQNGANTYAVTAQDPVDVTSNIVIELTKLTNVDRYAGFLNVDNGEIRTLAFARDKNDTSNKLYSLVEEANVTVDSEFHKYALNYEFANDIADAAQWQLVKLNSTTLDRVFVYNNTTTQSVDDVVDGDKVSAYAYALQYVVDGEATNYYLKNNYPSIDVEYYNDVVLKFVSEDANLNSSAYNDIKFYIKENVDGSVSLISFNDAFSPSISQGSNKVVAPAYGVKSLEVERSWDRINEAYYDFNTENIYISASSTNEVKTYLDAQPVDVSWPAKEGHVTLLSDMGNYITMNEDRDGIVVNEEVADTYYLYVTDEDAIVPSFYITRGIGATDGERMYMFNPTDSVDYYVADGAYDRVYQWTEGRTKVMFKAATINETRDTLTMDVKGETKYVAKDADDNNADIWGGINRFKWQIIEADDADGYYRIRQAGATVGAPKDRVSGPYLAAWNERLTWSDKAGAMLFQIDEAAAPTANEGVSATEVKIIATDGAINVKNAAGKNVVVSTILGQIVANEVLTSDNATISVPAGIAIVSIDGEEAVKVSVK